ncbi:hypothetical protein I315_06068 [Cryptococcus gattii Ru294]|nr:hypothetical protein I315_06068 [Cryptococcus gattii Ru294]
MAPSRSPSPRPRKRTKPSTACVACQHRKSRCEMLTPEGCHRCRTLRTRCSFILPTASISAPEGCTSRGQSAISVSLEQGQGTGLEENDILRQLDERTKRIEGLLRRETGARQPPVIKKDEGLRVERLQPVAGSVGAAVHLASALCVRSGWTWIDPVESGLLSGDAFEKAHARFLSTFYRILPLPHIIAVPTHPFVRLALITYLNPGFQPISSLLSSALTSLHMFEPSEDIVLALLIISHLPVSQYWTVIDPYGAGARAHQMAIALGLPDSARWLKLLKHEIEQEWNKSLLNRAILWYAVQHRASWIQIFTSPSMSWYPSTPPIHETVAFHFAQHLNSPALSHIVLDSLLMESLWPVIEALQAVRLSRQYEEQRVVALKDAWTVFEERAAAWSTEVESAPLASTPYQLLNCNILIVNMCLRLSTESATLCPTPIAPSAERLGTLLFFGSRQFRHSLKSIQSTLSHFTQPSNPIPTAPLSSQSSNATTVHTSRLPISHLPAFHLLACFLPLGVLLQSSKLYDETPSDHPVLIEAESLQKYKDLLASSHPAAPELIRRLENHSPSTHWRGAFDDILLEKENGVDWGLENPYGMFMWDGMLDLSDWAEGIDLTADWQFDPLGGI